MNPDKLAIGTVLKSRTTKNSPVIEDFQPAFKDQARKWLIKGNWFNLAELDARFTLPNPERKKKPQKA